MLPIPIHFRLEAADGHAAEEYRLHQQNIEVRRLQPNQREVVWHRLTADEIAGHVKRNTVVARWLERRLGWRRLLWACQPEDSPDDSQSPDQVSQQVSDHFAA
jgi:hypothetical protein